MAQMFSVLAGLVAVSLYGGVGPTRASVGWGSLSGIGSAVGLLALYRGLSVGSMSVVATASAVLTAAIPAAVGLLSGEQVPLAAKVGMGAAVIGIALVTRQSDGKATERTGVGSGVVAGTAFGLLFVALARAGTRSGAWPLLSGQLVALVLLAPLAWRSVRRGANWRTAAGPSGAAGLLGGLATLLFLIAAGRGHLATAAVLSALYPAVTVALARIFLRERWTRTQAVGYLLAGAAIVLIGAG